MKLAPPDRFADGIALGFEDVLIAPGQALVNTDGLNLRTALTAPSDPLRQASFREHQEIAAQLGRRDMDGFRATLAEHIDRTRRIATDELRRFQRKADETPASADRGAG